MAAATVMFDAGYEVTRPAFLLADLPVATVGPALVGRAGLSRAGPGSGR